MKETCNSVDQPDQGFDDPIKNVLCFHGAKEQFSFKVVHRRSGSVDIHVDNELVTTIEGPITEVDFDMEYIFIRFASEDEQTNFPHRVVF